MKLEIVQTGPIDVNTYILMDEESKEAVLIDVGGEFESIKKELDSKEYKINFILNTHGHFDHVLGEVESQQKYPEIKILMHKDDIPHILNMKQEMQYFGMNYKTDSLTLNEFIDENSSLFIGKNKIQIFHTPGHSKGSLSFYVDGKVFTGDALFYGSIGRTDFYDGDYDTLIESIKTKLLSLPEETIVYPGHGPHTTIQKEKKTNPYLI